MLCLHVPTPTVPAMEFRLIDRIRDRTALTREDVGLGIGDEAAGTGTPAVNAARRPRGCSSPTISPNSVR